MNNETVHRNKLVISDREVFQGMHGNWATMKYNHNDHESNTPQQHLSY